MTQSFLHMVCSATTFVYISTEAILIQLQFSLIFMLQVEAVLVALKMQVLQEHFMILFLVALP